MLEINSISPIDGRYRKKVEDLGPFFSEAALFKYRIIVEGEYLIALSDHPEIGLRKFKTEEKKLIRSLYEPSDKDILSIKKIESTTNHDVKAVEYFMKEKLKKTSLFDTIEWIHFALTSEDTNNISYALMLDESISNVIVPTIEKLAKVISELAEKNKNVPMLARTHGQPASPTTMGKEFSVFASRLNRQLTDLKKYQILAKLNGATGNYNAHLAAYPKVNWRKFTVDFLKNLNTSRGTSLKANLITPQIEPHDTYAELFDLLRRINVILIDFNQDIWRYISDGWIKQRAIAGEVGSSTMPHKINPIDFENSEGNLGIANALLQYFSNKLPISRLQRDLSDSTVERNFGSALAYCLIAYRSTLRGLGKIDINKAAITQELESHPEVLAELLQIIFRREGLPTPYELLKDLTRGKEVTHEKICIFIDDLKIDSKIKEYLKSIRPEDYIGMANKIIGK